MQFLLKNFTYGMKNQPNISHKIFKDFLKIP